MSQTSTLDLSRYRKREYTGPVFDVVETSRKAPFTVLKYVAISIGINSLILWMISLSDISRMQLWTTGTILIVFGIVAGLCQSWIYLIKEICKNLQDSFLMVMSFYKDVSKDLKQSGQAGLDKKTVFREVVFQIFVPGITDTIKKRVPVFHYPVNAIIKAIIGTVTKQVPPDDIPDDFEPVESPETEERIRGAISTFFKKSSRWLLLPIYIVSFLSMMGYGILLLSALITILFIK